MLGYVASALLIVLKCSPLSRRWLVWMIDPPPPPEIVIVFSAPVPEAVTPEPTKFKVVAAVDKALPSS